MDIRSLVRDLADEQQALDDLVAPLTGALWTCETPSPGWTVADQIGHLAHFDRQAHLAITDPLGREWLLIAQAFAGPPTEGPPPGTRPARTRRQPR